MQVIVDLPADLSIALRRFANGTGTTREEALVLALREYLISNGDLELASTAEEKRPIYVDR